MRTFGVILIVIGILMFFFRSCTFTSEYNVLSLKDIEINREQTQNIGWSIYFGPAIVLIGTILLYAEKKRKKY